MLVWMTRKPDRGKMSSLGMGGKMFSRKMSPNTARYPKLLIKEKNASCIGASFVMLRRGNPVEPDSAGNT